MVSLVVFPEICKRIYANVNGISDMTAEAELRFGAEYEFLPLNRGEQ